MLRSCNSLALSLLVTFVCTAVWGDAPITAGTFTPGRETLLIGSQSGVVELSWPALAVVSRLATELEQVHDLSFSLDGAQLLVAGGTPAESGIVEMWRWPLREKVHSIVAGDDLVYQAAWEVEGERWGTASGDGVCRIFERDRSQSVLQYTGHSRGVLAIHFLPGGDLVASGGVDQTMRLWDRVTGTHVRTLDNHVRSVNAIAVSPQSVPKTGPLVATTSDDRTIRIWQPTIGRMVRFAKLAAVARAVVWSADGAKLWVGCDDGHVRCLRVENLEVIADHAMLEGRIYVLLIGPQSSQLFVAGEGGYREFTVERQ